MTSLFTIARARASRVGAILHRYADILWWLHSAWALLVGVGVMWLGSRHYGLLRVAVFQIAFIWVASLVVTAIAERPAGTSPWANRLRLVINYFSRNFYQQLAYFLIPVYFASASRSWNLVFVALLGVSAILSSLDIVYDRHLSVRRRVIAVFFSFNLFACINAMLPILWSIGNAFAMRISAALALVAFATILYGRRGVKWRTAAGVIAVSAVVLVALVEFGRPLIPPAPLRVVSAQFGLDVNRRSMSLVRPLDHIDPGWSGRLYVLTAIHAPNGLEDRVRHSWYVHGRLVWRSPYYALRGGRQDGFRLWTSVSLPFVAGGAVRVDVQTEGGQLIGRSKLPVALLPAPLPSVVARVRRSRT